MRKKYICKNIHTLFFSYVTCDKKAKYKRNKKSVKTPNSCLNIQQKGVFRSTCHPLSNAGFQALLFCLYLRHLQKDSEITLFSLPNFWFPVAAEDLIPLWFTGSSLSTTSDKITHLHYTANTKCSPGTQNNPLPFLSKYLELPSSIPFLLE